MCVKVSVLMYSEKLCASWSWFSGLWVWMSVPGILQEAPNSWPFFLLGSLAASLSLTVQDAHLFSGVMSSSRKCGTRDRSLYDSPRMREKEKKNLRVSVYLLTVKLANLPRHLESPCLVLRVKFHRTSSCTEHSRWLNRTAVPREVICKWERTLSS